MQIALLKRMLTCLMCVCLVGVVGCGMEQPIVLEDSERIEVKDEEIEIDQELEWYVRETGEQEQDFNIYKLYLRSRKNPEIQVDLAYEFIGDIYELGEGHKYPKDACLPIGNWFAGGGFNLALKKEKETCYYVMVRFLEEGSTDYEGTYPSDKWEDYTPIAKLTLQRDEQGDIQAIDMEKFEVDVEAVSGEVKPVPLELSWSVWERQTKNSPSSWYRFYMTLTNRIDTTYDLGQYAYEPKEIDTNNTIPWPEKTIKSFYGEYKDASIKVQGYFALVKEENTLKMLHREYTGNDNNDVFKLIWEKDIVANQEVNLGEMMQQDKPYMSEYSYHPVVFNNVLLGGQQDDQMYSYVEMCDRIQGYEIYELYTLEEGYVKDIRDVSFTKIEDNTQNATGYRGEVMIDEKTPYLAVAGFWDAMPRIPKEQSNEAYYKSFPQSDILQNYRIDLEGDGVEEVIIVTKSDAMYEMHLRKIDEEGKVVTISQSANDEVKVVAIADVDGNGIMDMVVEHTQEGAHTYKVYTYREDQLFQMYRDLEDMF